jgi:hypothetical protein
MSFASPLWLLGLVPWAGVTIRLLLARRRRVAVPFVALWRGSTERPRAKPRLTLPPLATLLSIVALLFAVLASARPLLRSRTGPAVTIIVDRGITMSARGAHTERFKETCDLLASRLRETLGEGAVHVITVPGGELAQLDGGNWVSAIASASPSLQTSQPALNAAVRESLADPRADVIVVTDQTVAADDRLVQVMPQSTVSNLTIARVAAREDPHPEAMVELRDQNCGADVRPATVRIESAGQTAWQNVQIPRNGTATAFLDLPKFGPTISIDVDAPDDLPADNHAALAREQSAATIEDSGDLPEPLRRMIAVYRRHRDGSGKTVAIVMTEADIPADTPAVVLAKGTSSTSPTATLRVEDHPVSKSVDWSESTAGAGGLPPAGFLPIVSKGDAIFVAVREQPARSVWVCVGDSAWPSRAGYVIFWTNVFDWLGGEDVYRWHPVDGEHPQPGIEKEEDGTVRAYSAIDVDCPPVEPTDWDRLRAFKRSSMGGVDLTPAACLGALMLMTMGILIARFQR